MLNSVDTQKFCWIGWLLASSRKERHRPTTKVIHLFQYSPKHWRQTYMITACKTFSCWIGFNLQLTTNEIHPTCLKGGSLKTWFIITTNTRRVQWLQLVWITDTAAANTGTARLNKFTCCVQWTSTANHCKHNSPPNCLCISKSHLYNVQFKLEAYTRKCCNSIAFSWFCMYCS